MHSKDNPWPRYHSWLDEIYARNHEQCIKDNPKARELSEEEFTALDQRRGDVVDGYLYHTVTENSVSIRLEYDWELVGWRKFLTILYIVRKIQRRKRG